MANAVRSALLYVTCHEIIKEIAESDSSRLSICRNPSGPSCLDDKAYGTESQGSVDWRLSGARACPLDLRPRYGIYKFLCANCWNVIGQAPSVGNMHAAEPAALHLALGGCGQYREHL